MKQVNNTQCKRAAIYVNQLGDHQGSNSIERQLCAMSETESPFDNPKIMIMESIHAGLMECYQRNLTNEDLKLLVES